MKEIWKDIPSYEGKYQASNSGKIRSLDRVIFNKGCNGRQQEDIDGHLNNSYGLESTPNDTRRAIQEENH